RARDAPCTPRLVGSCGSRPRSTGARSSRAASAPSRRAVSQFRRRRLLDRFAQGHRSLRSPPTLPPPYSCAGSLDDSWRETIAVRLSDNTAARDFAKSQRLGATCIQLFLRVTDVRETFFPRTDKMFRLRHALILLLALPATILAQSRRPQVNRDS